MARTLLSTAVVGTSHHVLNVDFLDAVLNSSNLKGQDLVNSFPFIPKCQHITCMDRSSGAQIVPPLLR